MMDIRPMRARCARLKRDSQDMGGGSLFCGLSDLSGEMGSCERPPITLSHG
jgi:hypothetical protein